VFVGAKFGTCTVMSVGTLFEDKMRGFKSEFAHFSVNKSPIYTHDSASVKFSTNSQETDNSVCGISVYIFSVLSSVSGFKYCKFVEVRT
jgi:hypothetical protein